MAGFATARLAEGAGVNTINRRRVRIFFQRAPGTRAADGIEGLDFTLTTPGAAAPTTGRTPANGLVEMTLAAGETATLDILGSRYDISLLEGGLFPVAQLRGVQQRLNMLGYNAGPLDATTPPTQADTSQNGTEATEHAIINFQADQDPLVLDGIAGARTQPRLRQVVQGAGGE
jgi:hypothetical protein